ncbi:MAG: hypothetical protein QHJ73_02355 [Armatimonadota bacterium]|nr:hypothetical protein [Armatimonadota bacterium]
MTSKARTVCGVLGTLCLTAAGWGAEAPGVRDFIVLMPWDRLRGAEGVLSVDDAARGMKECGLNVAGFVEPKDLDLCARHGLRALVSDRRVSGYNWRNVNPDEVEKNIQALVAEVNAHPAVLGYYVKDEPSALEFPGLAVVVKALARHAPGKLAYINLYPDYATINNPDRPSQLATDSYQEYLDRFVAEVPVPVISYDNYSIEKDYSIRPSYFRNLLAIRQTALKADRVFWNVVTSNQVRPFRAAPSLASLAFQAYTTLAAGGRGVAYFTYYTGDETMPGAGRYAAGPLWNFRPTPTWEYLRTVNHAVAPLLPLLARCTATTLSFGPTPPAEGLPAPPSDRLAALEGEGSAMVGELRHADGTCYLMVVNCDLLRPAHLRLRLKEPGARLEVVVPTPRARLGADGEVYLEAGWGVLLREAR